MTIEEIKAIKRLEFILEDKRQCIGSEQNFKAIETVLKLVDRQQDEIEELENDRDYNYISKDKIKTKIEELEKHLEEVNNNAPKNKNGEVNRRYNNGVRTYYENRIAVLKDLLNNNDFIYKIWSKRISDCLGLNTETTTEHDYIEDLKKLLEE